MSRHLHAPKRPRGRVFILASIATGITAGFLAGLGWVAIDMLLRDTFDLPPRGVRNANPARSGA